MHPENEGRTEADAVAETVKGLFKPDVISIPALGNQPKAHVIAVPDGDGGMTLERVGQFSKAFRTAPERAQGRATLTRLESFIAHVVRNRTEETVVFAAETIDPHDKPSLTAVYDYHGRVNDDHGDAIDAAVGPQFGDHGAFYPFPLSEEWRVWLAGNGEAMSQADFAAFLEDRAIDVISPTDIEAAAKETYETGDKEGHPTAGAVAAGRLFELQKSLKTTPADRDALIELSRGLEVLVKETVQQRVKLSNGEMALQFSHDHQDAKGEPLKVPGMFYIAIPLFVGGDYWRMAVRLRYRAGGGNIKWAYELHRPDITFKAAFDEVLEDVRTQAQVPVMVGTPEPHCAGDRGGLYSDQ